MKILIIDDEPLIRKSLFRALSSRGHEVFLAQHGWEGLSIWRKQRPQIILLDMIMPGISGTEVLEQAEVEIRTGTEVILMSAYSGENINEFTKKYNIDVFITKPFNNIFEIAETIERSFSK